MRPFYDQSNIVNESIASVRDAIVIGLFLAGFIIWLFLRDWGTALMTGLVVPVTMVVTFIAMKVLGQSFNLMTLGGLAAAVGLVIDDKIVVVENIVLHRDGGEGPLQATASALKELTVPLIGSTLTPIVVFLPLITITGVTGTFFSALAIAMSVSLLTSLVLALVWTSNLSTQADPARHRRRTRQRRRACTTSRIAGRRGSTIRPAGGADAPHDGGGRSVAQRSAVFGQGARASTSASCAASLRHPRLSRRALCVLLVAPRTLCYRGTRQRPAAGVRRRRIRSRLRDAAGQFAPGNQSRARLTSRRSCAPRRKSRARRGAPGLELGLAAVTEPNTGDIAVKLKADRSRGVDDVISDVRAKVAQQSRFSMSNSSRCCRT